MEKWTEWNSGTGWTKLGSRAKGQKGNTKRIPGIRQAQGSNLKFPARVDLITSNPGGKLRMAGIGCDSGVHTLGVSLYKSHAPGQHVGQTIQCIVSQDESRIDGVNHVGQIASGIIVECLDLSPGLRPGLTHTLVAEHRVPD